MNNTSNVRATVSNEVGQALMHHWAMDPMAAESLAQQVNSAEAESILELVSQLDPAAVAERDRSRQIIGERFAGHTNTKLFLEGPCSEDINVIYSGLLDYIEESNQDHPFTQVAVGPTDNIDVVYQVYPLIYHAVRLNHAKPRSGNKWKGLWYSTDPSERELTLNIKLEAFNRGIPIVTEITEGPQLGALAPFLSAVWVGARDVESTALRGAMSGIHLPVGVKNPRDGSVKVVTNAIQAIRSNSLDNDGSGIDIGTIASNAEFRGVPTGILPVGQGNQQTAIIARGYELHEYMTKEERRQAAIKHLSEMCLLGVKLNCAVLIDGSHDVPPMFDIPRDNPDRFLSVLEQIHIAIENGEVENSSQIAGVMGEVGPEEGRTDRNLVLDEERKAQLKKLVGITVSLLA